MNNNKKKLPAEQHSALLKTLKTRFEKNMNRHKGLEWAVIQAKLEAAPATFKDPLTALSFCIQRGIRLVRLVGNSNCPGEERFIYPFGGDPVIKAQRKGLRRKLAENRRLQRKQRALMARIDALQAEAKERKKQARFPRNSVNGE